jgi:hypothetical protein
MGDLRILALNLCHFSSKMRYEYKNIRAALPIFTVGQSGIESSPNYNQEKSYGTTDWYLRSKEGLGADA